MGHRLGGGHMMSTAKFDDYVTASQGAAERPRFFVFSAAAVVEGDEAFAQSIRRGYGEPYAAPEGDIPNQCGSVEDYRSWFAYPEWFKSMVKRLQVEQQAPFFGLSPTKVFQFFDISPESNVIMFSQGSRFAASRAAIQSRPKSYYVNLLQHMNHEDPWAGYFLELLWWYVIGGSPAPCGFEDEIAESHHLWKMSKRFGVIQQQVSGVSGVSGTPDLGGITEQEILAMTDAQRQYYFVNRATVSGTVVTVQNSHGGNQIVLFIPVAGTTFTLTSPATKTAQGQGTSMAAVPCANTAAATGECEEAATIWSNCPIEVQGIPFLFTSNTATCIPNAFVACSIVRMRSDGSIISVSAFELKVAPCPQECHSTAVDNSYCVAGAVGTSQSNGCNIVVSRTSVVAGSTTTNTSSGSAGSNTGLFYIIFVLMIIPIVLVIAACLYYYFYHYKPARESEQYLAPCCAAPGYAYPPQMLTNTPALPVQYI